jgi:hypothetical protein
MNILTTESTTDNDEWLQVGKTRSRGGLSDHLQRPHIEKRSDPRRLLENDGSTRLLDFPHVGQLDKGDAARYLYDIDLVQEQRGC